MFKDCPICGKNCLEPEEEICFPCSQKQINDEVIMLKLKDAILKNGKEQLINDLFNNKVESLKTIINDDSLTKEELSKEIAQIVTILKVFQHHYNILDGEINININEYIEELIK